MTLPRLSPGDALGESRFSLEIGVEGFVETLRCCVGVSALWTLVMRRTSVGRASGDEIDEGLRGVDSFCPIRELDCLLLGRETETSE
jgi:hypothetical protein